MQVFDRDLDRADGGAFVERCENDRHHFRVIISPEHGTEFEDLKGYTRELVGTVEKDLNTRLDCIAAERQSLDPSQFALLALPTWRSTERGSFKTLGGAE